MAIRIGGLATGMDTQQMVDDLMRAERMPVDKMVQDRTRLEWQRDAYREMNLKLTSLRDSFRATGLGLQSTFLQKNVTSSNESIVRASGSATALDGTVQMQVNQLATASTYVSDVPADFDLSEKMLEEGEATLAFFVKQPGEEQPQKVEITIDENDTYESVINKLNGKDTGLRAYIDHNAKDGSQHIVLTMNETGAGAEISFSQPEIEEIDPDKLDKAVNFFKEIGFSTDENNALQVGKGQQGQNAEVVINGHTTQRTSNEFTISGLTYNLTSVSNGETVMITTETDTDQIMEDIMSFVEEYNELVDELNGTLREERHRDFPPLTDEQKEAMSEKEIELWEEKARSGLLRNDSTLSSALNQMRMALFSGVSGEGAGVIQDLAQIGLVSSKNYMDGGKIELDTASRTMPNGERMDGEARLRYYIENHGEELHQLFMGDGEEYAEKGVLRRIRETLDHTIDAVANRAGREGRTNQQFTIGREINSIEDRISNFERRLQQKEESYWRQFTALEKAIAEMNAQAEQMWSMLMPQG